MVKLEISPVVVFRYGFTRASFDPINSVCRRSFLLHGLRLGVCVLDLSNCRFQSVSRLVIRGAYPFPGRRTTTPALQSGTLNRVRNDGTLI